MGKARRQEARRRAWARRRQKARRRAWARRGHGCTHGEDTGTGMGTKDAEVGTVMRLAQAQCIWQRHGEDGGADTQMAAWQGHGHSLIS